MPKTKEQKRKEAQWRLVRGGLIDSYRERESYHGLPKILPDYVLDEREKFWEQYIAIPREWRLSALDGWKVSEELKLRLREHEALFQKNNLSQALPLSSSCRRRARM